MDDGHVNFPYGLRQITGEGDSHWMIRISVNVGVIDAHLDALLPELANYAVGGGESFVRGVSTER